MEQNSWEFPREFF